MAFYPKTCHFPRLGLRYGLAAESTSINTADLLGGSPSYISYRNRSGVRGTVVLFAAGDAEAGVVFDGENVETCERVLVRDLEAAGVGFRADPDTPAQPVVAQLLSLLGALLHSDDVSQALKIADSEGVTCDDGALVWLRVLSQSLMAVLHLSVHCSDTVVAACQDGDVVAHILPQLQEVALCPIQLPALITTQVRHCFVTPPIVGLT